MNTAILNRSGQLPADGWHQIEVPGEHVNHAAKVVQVIDQDAVKSILNRFQADAAKPNFAGVLIDKDHFSLDAEKPSEAMGWALELRNREGIPEARIDWSSVGRPLVEGKTYKFFSTVYEPGDFQEIGTRIVNGASYKLVRPLHLSRLALTNDPNNKGGKPISNRNGNPAGAPDEKTPSMKSLLKKLGLADDASEESAVAALTTIQNRAAQSDALTKERDALLADVIEADLTKYAPVIKNRDTVKAQLIANRTGTLALLESLQPSVAPDKKEEATRITNRVTATPPAGEAEKAATKKKEDEATAQRIANRAHELVKSKKIPFATAFAEASRENGK